MYASLVNRTNNCTYRIKLLLKSANSNFGRYEMFGIISIRFCDARKFCSDSNPSIWSREIEETLFSFISKRCGCFIWEKLGKLWRLLSEALNWVRDAKGSICIWGIIEMILCTTFIRFSLVWCLKSGNVYNFEKSTWSYPNAISIMLALKGSNLLPPMTNLVQLLNAVK